MGRTIFAALLLGGLLAPHGSQGEEARTPILGQIALPHSYYYRELYLPQLTNGPSAVDWTPDGQSLVYSMAGTLWRQRLGSPVAEQLTDGDGYDYQPDVSPDGKSVAFVRYDGKSMELMLLDLAAGAGDPRARVRPLTANGAVNVEPRWSPDGTSLAFVSTLHTGHFLVHFAKVTASGLTDLHLATPDRKSAVKRYYYSPFDHAISPVWTREGAGLYFISNREVPHGTGSLYRQRTLVLSLPVPSNPGEAVAPPAPRTPLPEPIVLHREETPWKARPDLSPDGTRFVYASYLGSTWHQLWLLPVGSNGTAFPLTYGDYDNTSPRWSPDGRSIAFLSNRDGDTAIWIVGAFDGAQKKIEIGERRYLRERASLRLRVVDEAGTPVPARLSVTDARGRFLAPSGVWIHGDDAIHSGRRYEAHYVHVPGEAVLEVPRERLRITAGRGPEYAITTLDLDPPAAGASFSDPLVVTLRRLRLPEGFQPGWSGDLHVHMSYTGTYRNTPERLLAQARAEDLDLIYNLVVNKEQRIPDQASFAPGPDRASTPDALLLHGQEFHTSFWGHLGLLNLQDHLILPDYAGYPYTPAASLYPHNRAVADFAHAQKGLVGYVHPFEVSEVRGVESGQGAPLTNALPVDAALGKVDYYEVVGFADHGASAEVWYKLLGCGVRLPIGAGTDAMANYASLRGPVGLNRVYVPGQGPVDGERFLAQLKAGHSFATNGPLLDLKLEGKAPGDTLQLEAGERSLNYRLAYRSNVPVDHLELVWNGEVVSRLPLAGEKTSATSAGELKVKGSGWLLLRAWSDHPRSELMDLYPYATTSPIYVEMKGSEYRDPAAGHFFLRWLDRMRPIVAAHPDWRTPEERAEVLRDIDKARTFYERCAEGKGKPENEGARPRAWEDKEDKMTIRAVDPFEALNQTISGGIVLLGVMFLSLPVIVLGLALLGVERWILRRRASALTNQKPW